MSLLLSDLVVGYRSSRGAVLNAINRRVEPGSFVCVLGRNGSGKSTLLRTVSGLQAPLSGSVFLNDEALTAMAAEERARRVAVVLTERVSSPGLSVADVIAMGRQPHTAWHGRLSAQDLELTAQAAQLLGVERFMHRLLDDLSDGERQRVMMARALAQSPSLLVLDEITAFLDLPGRVEVMSDLRRLAHKNGVIVLLSSHDLDLSLQLADQLWLVEPGSDTVGTLYVGKADELIGSGRISDAFGTRDVSFDAAAKRFVLTEFSQTNT
jgi:iron complex transport system ATP-binding protein